MPKSAVSPAHPGAVQMQTRQSMTISVKCVKHGAYPTIQFMLGPEGQALGKGLNKNALRDVGSSFCP